MTIARILSDKGREVVTTQPHRTLAEAADILVARNIGAVVVADAEGKVLGIVSERDIVRAISKGGAAALSDAVTAHMTGVVETREDEHILSAMEKMTKERFRHLPVMSEGRLAGIVSIGDLVNYRIAECEFEHRAMREYIATGGAAESSHSR
ncbi:CBS domain-containing protein [Methylocapsa acidiphila]|uniref:CBS domain-containing protein n=1 Tax=Methylocapsa acidiphila TaxID=133552 RepID=UPI00041460E6|nr:CBS domain-containing protein [Methylocapsa acidiphila]